MMRKLLTVLKWAALVFSVLLNLVVIALAVLYWLYPNQFVERGRYFSDPWEEGEVSIQSSAPDTSAPLSASTILEVKLPFTEKDQRNVLIYLPKGYQAGNKDFRYPTVYLLHGVPGTEIDWPQKGKAGRLLDEAIDKHTLPPVIAVFPNGHPNTVDSEYVNSVDGKEPVEDFIVKTVVAHVDRTYPTYADSPFRAIGGLSEGGLGAINLGLKHQDVFGAVIAVSGYGNVDNTVRAIHGDPKATHDNSPTQYVPELRLHSTRILLTVGDRDAWFLKENQELDRVLKEHHFAVEMRTSSGVHNWTFFSAHLKEGLEWWGKGLAADMTWDGQGTLASKQDGK